LERQRAAFLSSCSKNSHLGGKTVELAEEVKELLKEAKKALKGSARRLFMG